MKERNVPHLNPQTTLFTVSLLLPFCMLSSVNIKLWAVVSPDQSMLDDIEKTINDDMKRIISWLQQLK